MSDSEDSDTLGESMNTIHSLIETLSHESKTIYSKALKISSLIEHPDINIWLEEFHIHERAYKWAKHHLVPRKCTLWQIHRTLLESAKKDKRLSRGHVVRLLQEEADIMDLPSNHPISVWQVLGRLPRFFL
jgi:hypothetical protein